jgi:hypothetical protein
MQEKIKNDIKDAMRARDSIRLDTLRGLSIGATSLPDRQAGLSDDEVIAVIRRATKQRRDSIEQFEKGGRKDLADKEKSELVILESYLPKLMSRLEIEKFIKAKIAGGAAFDKTKTNQFIGLMMKELKGKADGTDVKAVIESLA